MQKPKPKEDIWYDSKDTHMKRFFDENGVWIETSERRKNEQSLRDNTVRAQADSERTD
jgi:hypothetical protein